MSEERRHGLIQPRHADTNGTLSMIPSINDAIRDGRSIYLPVNPGPVVLSEHTGIGHEGVHLTATGDEDGFKSTLPFRA